MNGEFNIANWRIQPSLNRIVRHGETIQLEPRVMGVLVRLSEQPDEVIARDVLIETIWADTVVEEEALTRAVSELRKAFGDDPRNPCFIETIRKVGYRLIAPVTPIPAQRPAPPISAENKAAKAHPATWWVAGVAVFVMGLAWLLLSSHSASVPLARIVPFTSYPGLERYPALSPDGNQVAFSWNGEHEDFDLYVKLVGTERPLRLTSGPEDDLSPAWSPDGRWLAFVRRMNERCDILTIPALGGPERKLATCSPYTIPTLAWSADGTQLVFSSRTSLQEPSRLYLLSVETRVVRPLTQPPAQTYGDDYPVFSPAALHEPLVAFTRTDILGITDLYVISVEGGLPRRLTSDNLKIRGIDWKSNGRELVFSSNRNGNFNLWHMPVSGGEPKISLLRDDIVTPSLSRGAARLAYESWYVDINIWRMPNPLYAGAPAPSTPFIVSTQWDSHPHYSLDGRRIAFASMRSGSPEIWMCHSDGSNPVQLTFFGGPFTGTPRWSPDSRFLVFESRAEGNADLYLLSIEGGLPRRLTSAPSVDVAPSWAADGQSIYFNSNRNGTWQVWNLPLEGSQPVPVTQQGGSFAAESPDGKWLYYTKFDVPGLWNRSVTGGKEVRLIPSVAAHESNWIVTKDGLFFVPEDAPHTLAYYERATGDITLLVTFDKELNDPALSLSPDGRWLLHTQVDEEESDIWLVENFR